MTEHTFDPIRRRDLHEGAVTRSIELAERVLDEVSSARQDWRAVAAMAVELAGLAGRLAGPARLNAGRRSPEPPTPVRTTLRDVP